MPRFLKIFQHSMLYNPFKNFVFLGLFILNFNSINNVLYAQKYEIGVQAGGLNFVGDVGATTYVNPTDFAAGVIFKWNRSPRHSYRFSFLRGNISGNDSQSKDPSRRERNLQFKNTISELAIGMEYHFFDFDLMKLENKEWIFTPYIFAGVVFTNHIEGGYNATSREFEDYFNVWSPGIPLALGLKITLSQNFILSVESGARFMFTDQLDGNNFNTPNSLGAFGNINSYDWYFFTGISLTYTFGRLPCFCTD